MKSKTPAQRNPLPRSRVQADYRQRKAIELMQLQNLANCAGQIHEELWTAKQNGISIAQTLCGENMHDTMMRVHSYITGKLFFEQPRTAKKRPTKSKTR